MQIYLKFDTGICIPKPYEVEESTTVGELAERLSSSAELKTAKLSSIVFAGRNLMNTPGRSLSECLVQKESTLHILSIRKLDPFAWKLEARRIEWIHKLGPLKPVATPNSSLGPRTLSYNWREFSENERQEILENLSRYLEIKVQVHLVGNMIIFYLQNYMEILCDIANRDLKEVLNCIGSGGVTDPEMLSLIYIMFGDLVGLSPLPRTEQDLTETGKRIYATYLELVA